MFNSKDTLFNKKDESAQKDSRDSRSPNTARLPGNGAATAVQTTTTAAAAGMQAPASVPTPTPSGSKLIVGPDIKLNGVEITDCDTLVVEGRVEASMDSRVIQIAERGVYADTVCIDVAEIHGRFEGELTARKHLLIHSSGRVSGTIRYGKITIEDGGELSGAISTLATGSEKVADAPVDIMTPYDPFAGKSSPLAKPATVHP